MLLNMEKLRHLMPLSGFLSVLMIFDLMVLNYLTMLNESKLFANQGVVWGFIAPGWLLFV